MMDFSAAQKWNFLLMLKDVGADMKVVFFMIDSKTFCLMRVFVNTIVGHL